MSNEQINQTLQWIGVVFVTTGYVLSALGAATYPWNIASFLIGAMMFLGWAIRVSNRPQIVVNAIAAFICFTGLIKGLMTV